LRGGEIAKTFPLKDAMSVSAPSATEVARRIFAIAPEKIIGLWK
jgi:hypothetical protein